MVTMVSKRKHDRLIRGREQMNSESVTVRWQRAGGAGRWTVFEYWRGQAIYNGFFIRFNGRCKRAPAFVTWWERTN